MSLSDDYVMDIQRINDHIKYINDAIKWDAANPSGRTANQAKDLGDRLSALTGATNALKPADQVKVLKKLVKLEAIANQGDGRIKAAVGSLFGIKVKEPSAFRKALAGSIRSTIDSVARNALRSDVQATAPITQATPITPVHQLSYDWTVQQLVDQLEKVPATAKLLEQCRALPGFAIRISTDENLVTGAGVDCGKERTVILLKEGLDSDSAIEGLIFEMHNALQRDRILELKKQRLHEVLHPKREDMRVDPEFQPYNKFSTRHARLTEEVEFNTVINFFQTIKESNGAFDSNYKVISRLEDQDQYNSDFESFWNTHWKNSDHVDVYRQEYHNYFVRNASRR